MVLVLILLLVIHATVYAGDGRGHALAHKHLPEMTRYAGLSHAPVFAPAVGRFAQGMIVEAPLQLWALPGMPRVADLQAALNDAYAGERFVIVAGADEVARLQGLRTGAGGYTPELDPEALNGANALKLYVFGDDARCQARWLRCSTTSVKARRGAAVQNLNLMLGFGEATGL